MSSSGEKKLVFRITSNSVSETMHAAEEFAAQLRQGDTVLLKGDLGAGKTHFVKGVARFFDIPEDEVQSPTFSLIHEYPGTIPVYHLDCYRLQHPGQAVEIGLEEYLYGDGICLIEWPERIESHLPDSSWDVEIRHGGENQRKIIIRQSV